MSLLPCELLYGDSHKTREWPLANIQKASEILSIATQEELNPDNYY